MLDVVRMAKTGGVDVGDLQSKIEHVNNIHIRGLSVNDGSLLWERKNELSVVEKNYYTFTFVRDPVDRVESVYRSKFLGISPTPLQKKLSKNVTTVSELVDYVCNTKDVKLDRCLKSQSTLIGDAPLDFIGKVDNFDADWKIVADKIGLEDTNVKLNESEPSVLSAINNADRLKLVERFADDYKKFQYPT